MKLLFVCVENSNRSQMAEAFARLHGGQAVQAWSAGSRPSGKVNPRAIASMRALDYDLSAHSSRSIDEVCEEAGISSGATFDAVVTMGCGDSCPHVPSRLREDWQIPDPRELEPGPFAEVRDTIRTKVVELLARLEAEPSQHG